MVNGLVTVVLPVYNVEKYLERCIVSVVNQTYENIEIILVDDGSTDGSAAICDSWTEKDGRIRVIHKQNQGLGMARNTGIENASGEYVCFFDSDDYVAPDTIEKSYRRAKEEKADIVLFGMNFADENGDLINSFVTPLGSVSYEKEAVLDFFLPEFIAPDPCGDGTKLFYMSPCLMLYSLETVRKAEWKFVSEREIISEDVYSLLGLFRFVEKVSVIPEAYYFYCRNGESLSRKYRKDRFQKLGHFYTETKKLCESIGYDEKIIHRVSKPYLSFVIGALKQESRAGSGLAENMARIKELVSDNTLQSVLQKNRKDKFSLSRKILFFAMRNKLYGLCFLLLRSRA